MIMRRVAALAVLIVCLTGFSSAQGEEPPLTNWPAPPYWSPIVQPRVESGPSGMLAHAQGMRAQAEALPSSPLPFVAIAPCRIVDTRVPVSDGFHQPNFTDDESRTFPLPSSTDCTGLPATAGAWSLNIQFRPISQLSFLTAFPTGTTMPGVSTMTASPAAWVQNAAIVPAGSGGAIDIYCQYAGRVVIDINGYYGPQSVVMSLNALIGDVTLAEGSNVTITPSGQTLTIAATGGPGGVLPTGSSGQTLRNNGSAWVASSALTNNGINVGISGNLVLPATTATAGQFWLGPDPFLHGYAAPGNDGVNTFVGLLAGNFTAGGASSFQGSNNTGLGGYVLYADTTGYGNTATGSNSMHFNTTGYYNTATGLFSLYSNLDGSRNTAAGLVSLYSNTSGNMNTAIGSTAMYDNTEGSWNVAVGSYSLYHNTSGNENVASGVNALGSNTTASANTALGNQALFSQSFDNAGVSWESFNTAVGNRSLHSNQPVSNITGLRNTAVGADSLHSNTTGSYNTAAGYQAGYANTSGMTNTFIGAASDAGAADLTNATAIGYSATVSQDNSLVLGNSIVAVGIGTSAPNTKLQVVGNIRVGTSGTNGCLQRFDGTGLIGNCASDARLKTEIRSLDPVLGRVAQLRPVRFRWRAEEFPDRHFGTGVNIGLVAQDVEQVFPELVSTDEQGYKLVSSSELPYLTLAAVRELKAKADALAAENSDLRAELRRLAAAVAELQAAVR